MSEALGGTLLLGGVALLLAAGGISVFQCVLWLKDGFWTTYEVRSLWGGTLFQFKWAGVTQIATWFCTQPLSAGAAMAAIPFMGVGMLILMSRDGPH